MNKRVLKAEIKKIMVEMEESNFEKERSLCYEVENKINDLLTFAEDNNIEMDGLEDIKNESIYNIFEQSEKVENIKYSIGGLIDMYEEEIYFVTSEIKREEMYSEVLEPLKEAFAEFENNLDDIEEFNDFTKALNCMKVEFNTICS